MKDYYKILEVNENSTIDEIKKSYRVLSKKYHPDVNPQGDERFKEISEAYDILSDTNKRAQYDNQRKNPFQGGNMNDIFSQMFGNSPFQQQRRKQAPDKVVKVQISPVESYLGVEKTIQYMKDNHCQTCNGAGGEQQACNSCGGQGFHLKSFGTGFMVQHIRTACPTCAGRGYTLIHKCHSCNGVGTKSSVNTVNIKLPHGIDNGQYLRLENQGDFKNGDYGDLIIQVELVNKDGFEKINNDLVYNLFLDWEGLKSKKYDIPHPNGGISVDAPNIFDTSKPLRIRRMGYNGGDMYIKLNVKFKVES